MKNQQDIEDSIGYMKETMESCYAYGGGHGYDFIIELSVDDEDGDNNTNQ